MFLEFIVELFLALRFLAALASYWDGGSIFFLLSACTFWSRVRVWLKLLFEDEALLEESDLRVALISGLSPPTKALELSRTTT